MLLMDFATNQSPAVQLTLIGRAPRVIQLVRLLVHEKLHLLLQPY